MDTRASEMRPTDSIAANLKKTARWPLRLQRFFVSLGLSVRSPASVRHLRIVERLSVASKGSVILINCSGVNYLAGLGTEGVTSLLCVGNPEDLCSPPAAGGQC